MRTLNKMIATLMLAALVLSGCETSNQYGSCIGYWEDDRRDPHLHYNLSFWNAAVGILGIEVLLIPTVLWLRSSTYCPTGYRSASK